MMETSADVAGEVECAPVGPIGVSSPIAGKTYAAWIVGLVAFVIAAGAAIQLLGRSGGVPGPDPAQVERLQVVDGLAAQGDCAALRDHVVQVAADLGVPGTAQHSDNVVFVRHADDAMRRIGCRIVEPSTRRVPEPFTGAGKSARY